MAINGHQNDSNASKTSSILNVPKNKTVETFFYLGAVY